MLGAINKNTNNYENIMYVEKTNKYKCICCDQDLILRKGNKYSPSFIHKLPNNCIYFKNPTEEQILNDAKLYLKEIIKNNKVDLYRKCSICKFKIKMIIPNFDQRKMFDMDMFYLDNNKNIICKFEVYNKNVINEENNFECYKINMMDLIYMTTINYATQKVELLCNKTIICKDCIK